MTKPTDIWFEFTGPLPDSTHLAYRWLNHARCEQIGAELIGVGVSFEGDQFGNLYVAHIRVEQKDYIVTVSDPFNHRPDASHKVTCRQPIGNDLGWFSVLQSVPATPSSASA